MSLIRKIIYGKPSGIILKKFLSLFYKEEYLNGKYFDEKRMGFWTGSCACESLPEGQGCGCR